MTSVQERLQLKRIALDKWTIREQLCLASAVSCSGDQNWMSVSRSLKMLCGANRPADWFSQKSCAVQYGDLLENVETPKRKKRTTSERDTQTAETPTESILRKLTQERITELKAVIQAEHDEYNKLREEILAIQNGTVDEAQLRQMWAQIEQEMDQKHVEKQKHEQWLKEREERKTELQKASRIGIFQAVSGTQSKPPQLNLSVVKTEDVETDDSNSKQGASPLLTSLLKSPATTPTTSNSPTNVRASAPTITNLLTGNTSSVLSINSSSSGQSFQLLQNQPLTGPVPTEAAPQIMQSPSQAAPTLSMLLENKNANKAPESQEKSTVIVKTEHNEPEAMETEDDSGSPNKEEEQQLMEVFRGLIPDNIDEDIEEILTNNNAIILNPGLLEEESILENVDSLIDEVEDDCKDKAMGDQTKSQSENSKNLSASTKASGAKEDIKQEKDVLQDAKTKQKIEDSSGGGPQSSIQDIKVKTENKPLKHDEKKLETSDAVSSNDDNSDNDVQIIESKTSAKRHEGDEPANDSGERKVDNPADIPDRLEVIKQNSSPQKESITESGRKDEKSFESGGNVHDRKEYDTSEMKSLLSQEEYDQSSTTSVQTQIMKMMNETMADNISDATTTITIIDTDEDSAMEVIKDDKNGKFKKDYTRRKPEYVERRLEDTDETRLSISHRKIKDRDGSESPLIDDENSDSTQRTRRRYSSTPNIDSIPSSPASSDDREYRAWKKSVLATYNKLCSHKYASTFLKTMSEDSTTPSCKQIILRPMDLQTIKSNIESGVTRTTADFQRDVMLMCQNAIMYYSKDHSTHGMAKEIMTDIAMSIENFVENARKEVDQRSGSNSSKNRARKSGRLP